MNLKINYHKFTTLKTSSKMKKIITIILVLSVACSTKQQISKTQVSDKKPSIIEISVIEGESISFTIKNTTTESVYIYQPRRLHIEKFNNSSWENLRILPCPCDAPCNAPTEKEELTAGESFNLSWNKEESWCGKERINNVRNTVQQLVEKGTYRIVINIIIDNKKKLTIYQEFTIN